MRSQLKKKTNTYKVTLIIFTFLYLSINTVNGQGPVDVFGTVQDSISQPLSLVTVILFDIDNQYISNFRTKDDRRFYFKISPSKSNYVLKFKSLSYKADDVHLKIEQNLLNYNFKVIMSPEITELNEVVVSATRCLW